MSIRVVSKENYEKALNVADEKTKEVLITLFGDKVVPTLDDYQTIRTYEDACIALGETMHVDFEDDEPDEVAYKKLKTISRALWGNEGFVPRPNPRGDETYYYPWFALYTQDEIDDMDEDDRGARLGGHAHTGASAGFGYLTTAYRSSYSHASLGFRLCQETGEKAEYFGKQFIKLWADYLLFDIKFD